jgi:transposase
MYVKKTEKKYRDKTYTNYLLVEAVQTPKGPRQEVFCSLGDLRPRPREEWLELARKVERDLSGQKGLFKETDKEVEKIVRRAKRAREEERFVGANKGAAEGDLIRVHVDGVRTEKHRQAGAVHVGLEFWRRLELDRILTEAKISGRACKLTCAMVMNRLIMPKSELATPGWIRETALEDILGEDYSGLSEDSLYRNLDRLYPSRAKIETALSEVERDLFNLDQTVYFYDLTSTYFEGGAKVNGKAKLGYSRDKRPDCPQVVVGLVVNRDGFPRAHEVFEGNLQDRKSLGRMLDLLDQRVGLKVGQTVVVDRGMAYQENLEEIKSRGLHYIVAARQSERNGFLPEFEEEAEFEEVVRQPSPRNPFQEKTTVVVKMKRKGDETYVLCISDGRKEKDLAIRQKQEKRLLSDVKKLEKRIEQGKLKKEAKIGEAIGRLKERYPRVARYYTMEYDEKEKRFCLEQDEEKLRKAEKLDGSYLLRSDRTDLNADETWRIYSLLTRAEKAFQNMKSPLSERPIFHHLERRVDTHIFLCVLAYHVLVSIEKTFLDRGVHTSWATIREILSTHEICTIVLPTEDGSELRIRRDSVPEPQHKQIYDFLNVPYQIIKPRKTWSTPCKDDVGTEKNLTQ